MVKSNLASPIKLCKHLRASYNVSSVVFVFSMLSLGHILVSDLLVVNKHMYSFSRYDSTSLSHTFFTLKVFLHEINITEQPQFL